MERNEVRITGQVRELKPLRTSPAGVAHRELLLEHRSCQMLAGQPREVRALVTVKVSGPEAGRLDQWQPGDRITVSGLLAQASHRDATQLLIHAQAIERFE